VATQNSQRIAIWIIVIVLAGGTLGLYFSIILQSKDQKNQTAAQDTAAQPGAKPLLEDKTAFKVDGKVDQLQKMDLKVGDGAEVKATDKIRAHYKGTIAQTGVKFDSSYDRGTPIDIGLDSVIVGWQQGVPGMKVGGKRRLVIPASMAYGDKGSGPVPANSDLVFEIEVLAVNPPATDATKAAQ
jgi:FKBP-type peptidyl-prolyl cis-trans isomerase